MNLITRFELAPRSDSELRALHREMLNALVRSPRHGAARRNALASLENIEAEIASRPPRP